MPCKAFATTKGRLRSGVGNCRRDACFDLLVTMCETINTLMRIDSEDVSQAGSTETPPATSSAGAGAATAPDDSHETASQLHQVDSATDPINNQSIAASDRDGEPASRLLQPPLSTDGERIGDESNATGVSVAVTQGDGSSRDSSGSVADERSASQTAAPPLRIFNCATSKGENNTFRALFKAAYATPRKTQRVNV